MKIKKKSIEQKGKSKRGKQRQKAKKRPKKLTK